MPRRALILAHGSVRIATSTALSSRQHDARGPLNQASWLQVPVQNGEGLQVLHYQIGELYQVGAFSRSDSAKCSHTTTSCPEICQHPAHCLRALGEPAAEQAIFMLGRTTVASAVAGQLYPCILSFSCMNERLIGKAEVIGPFIICVAAGTL